MSNTITLHIDSPTDRDTIATILFRNGYTVRLVKAKTGKARAKAYIEATEQDKTKEDRPNDT